MPTQRAAIASPTRRVVTAPALILTATFITVLPLLLHGTSCGHDLTFHLLNWMDAAHQWRQGTLRPWWCAAAAWNTGEARFLFYPPLSCVLGALCTLIVGVSHAPVLYTGIAIALSGFTMRSFLADYVSQPLALLGACLYLAHPYMLFTAFERSAYAELLAAAWLPWMLREALRLGRSPNAAIASVHALADSSTHHAGKDLAHRAARLALPIALLILTNLPAAVLATYALALVTAIRCLLARRVGQPFLRPILLPNAAAYLLATTLSAWYLLPAIVQRSAVEVAQAFTAGMRPEDGTLFAHTGKALHDSVVRQASWLAVLLLTVATVAACSLVATGRHAHRMHGMRQAGLEQLRTGHRATLLPVLLALTAVILFLLTPASLPVWHHAPELRFLQFPFRTLMLQGVLTVALITFAVRSHIRQRTAAIVSLAAVTVLTFSAHHHYAQVCDDEDIPSALLTQYLSGRGFEPYDEYTPRDADNDLLRPGMPPAWLAATPDAKAPVPATSGPQASPVLTIDEGRSTVRSYAMHTSTGDRFIVIRQRQFPNWHAAIDGASIAPEGTRDDGLLALPLPAVPGEHTLRLTYTWSSDQVVGALISTLALTSLLVFWKPERHPSLSNSTSKFPQARPRPV